MEEAVLLVLSRKSPEKDGWIRISRESILDKINAVEENIKCIDTITKHTNELQKKGYLEKDWNYNKEGKKIAKYKINKAKFRVIGNPVYDLDIKLAVFLARLYDFCWNNTNEVRRTTAELLKGIKISKSSFYKNIKTAIALGIIKKTREGYSFSSYWFPLKNSVIKVNKPTKEQITTMNQIAKVDSKIGHCAKWFLEENIFEQENWKDIYNKVLSGTLVCDKKDDETEYPRGYAMD